MSTWRDSDRWAAWLRGDDCPICGNIGVKDETVVAELDVSRVMMPETGAPMRGYVWIPVRRHVVELYELEPAEGAAFMRDVQRVSRAVAAATGAVKLNYEIHGNTVPHLHLHLFPRYVGDRFEGGPIVPRSVTGPVYAPGEYTLMRQRIAEALRI